MKKSPFHIVTHNGNFHADEVFSIALIRQFAHPLTEFTRSRDISDHMFNDKNTIVLDVGGKYDISKSNLDHHHDSSLASSVILTLKWLLVNKYIDADTFDFLVEHPVIQTIDRIDRVGYLSTDVATINQLVRSLNGDMHGFASALDLCIIVLDGILNQYQIFRDSQHAWENCTKKNGLAIHKGSQPIIKWREWAKKQGIIFLVVPGSQPGTAKVISRESELYPITEHKDQNFLHNAQFVAEYNSWDSAVSHATLMAAFYISH